MKVTRTRTVWVFTRLLNVLSRKLATFRRMSTLEKRAWLVFHAQRLGRVLRVTVYAPVYLAPGLILAAMGFRFLPVPNRWRGFGDLIEVPAQYVRAEASGVIGRHRRVLLAPSGKTSNRALIHQWRAHFTVIENPVSVFLLLPFTWLPGIGYGLWNWQAWKTRGVDGKQLRGGLAMLQADAMYDEKHGSLKVLDLPPDLATTGRDRLTRLGVKKDDWWVTLHVRERGYHQDDDNQHRNGDVSTYYPAMRAIADRGGWVIRVGDPSMRPLPPMDHVIDYVHTDAYCDWMDLFLAAHCRFMLGVSSGPCTLPVLYGKPMVCTNLAPVGPLPTTKNSLVIPKLHWLDREGRFMRTSEVLQSRLAVAYYQDMFEKTGVVVTDNTSEEITSVTTEMIDILEGSIKYSEEDERHQSEFRKQWLPNITPDLWGGRNRVGRAFLRNHGFLRE